MNKPNFTPGPWYVEDSEDSDFYLITNSRGSSCFTHNKDDANLIKAAPKMYAALEACHEAMAYMSEYDIPLTLHDQVKEALAEARGDNGLEQ